jgi:DNA-binding IclR family transcriptional regulator
MWDCSAKHHLSSREYSKLIAKRSSGVGERIKTSDVVLVSMPRNDPIQSIEVMFDTLETLVATRRGGVSMLASELDRPKSTIHDHLRTLEQLGYIIKEGEEYRPSTKLLELGARSRNQMEIYKQAKKEINSLAEETGEHSSLVVEENGRGVLLHTARGDKAVEVDTHSGMRIRLHTTAPGKAILAYLRRERVETIIDEHGLPAMTNRTITERAALFENLETIRERGYALDREERIEGMRAVAAPVLSRDDDVLGAVSIYGPTNRIAEMGFEDTLPKQLLRTANIIEINYNYQ